MKRFKKPTVEEVQAYCKLRGNNIDAEDFMNFYDTNGWVQGKARKPIKCWKACIRTWESMAKKNPAFNSPSAPAHPSHMQTPDIEISRCDDRTAFKHLKEIRRKL